MSLLFLTCAAGVRKQMEGLKRGVKRGGIAKGRAWKEGKCARCSVAAGEKVAFNHDKCYSHPIMTVAERKRVSTGYRRP